MAKITSVEPQKKNPRRFNVFLDGQFAFGADEDLVVEWRLIPGKELTTSDVEKLLFEAEVGKLMERMYRLFNIRQRSEREVRNYFRIKNYELRIKGKEQVNDLAVELVIKKLKQKGLLNDEQFARSWVEARRRSKKKGKRTIKAELYQKGINRELIDQILEEESTPESEQQLAQQALEKKFKSWEKLLPLELNEKSLRDLKKKAYGFLLRRGFEYDVVKDVVEKYLNKM